MVSSELGIADLASVDPGTKRYNPQALQDCLDRITRAYKVSAEIP